MPHDQMVAWDSPSDSHGNFKRGCVIGIRHQRALTALNKYSPNPFVEPVTSGARSAWSYPPEGSYDSELGRFDLNDGVLTVRNPDL